MKNLFSRIANFYKGQEKVEEQPPEDIEFWDRIGRYFNDIDILRGFQSRSAAIKIRASIIKLNREGISEIDLSNCWLKDCDLRNVSLQNSMIIEADLRGALLVDADLTDTVMVGCDLRGADLEDADIAGGNLCGAVLYNAYLKNVGLENCILKETKGLTLKQLSTVKSLLDAKLDPSMEKKITAYYPYLLTNNREQVLRRMRNRRIAGRRRGIGFHPGIAAGSFKGASTSV